MLNGFLFDTNSLPLISSESFSLSSRKLQSCTQFSIREKFLSRVQINFIRLNCISAWATFGATYLSTYQTFGYLKITSINLMNPATFSAWLKKIILGDYGTTFHVHIHFNPFLFTWNSLQIFLVLSSELCLVTCQISMMEPFAKKS